VNGVLLHLRDCDEFVTFQFVFRNKAICGYDRLGAVGAHLFVSTIVEEDYVTAADLLCYFPFDCRGWGRVPVIAGDIPHYRLKAQIARDAERGGAASAERRAEETGVISDRILQSRAAVGKLLVNLCGALQRQQGMCERVVADYVARLGDLSGDFPALLDVASDHKKSCVHVVFREDFEKTQSVRIVGTVVVSERDLFGTARKAREGAAVPLAGGRHGLESRGSKCGCSGGSGEHGSKHARIVMD